MGYFIRNGQWALPAPTSNSLTDILELIQDATQPVPPDVSDEVVWKNSEDGKFSVSSIIVGSFSNLPNASRADLIWFKGNIGKYTVLHLDELSQCFENKKIAGSERHYPR